MTFYLLFYLINILLAFIADKYYEKNKAISVVLLAIVVLIHTFVIGLRDIGVGIDTGVYIESYCNDAISTRNFHDFITSSHDLGYLLLSIVCVKIVPLPQSLLAGTEFFVILFFILGMWNYRKIYLINIGVMFTMFCFMYSMHTLNLMRQSCALSLLFYSFSLFLQAKKGSYLIFQIVACFFHATAFFFVVVPLFYYIASIESRKLRYLAILGVVILLVASINSYYTIVEIVGNISPFEDYSENYGSESQFAANGFSHLSLRSTITTIFLVIVLFRCKNKHILDDDNNERMFFFMMLLYLSSTIIIQYLPTIMKYAGRIGYYILVIWMVYYTRLLSNKHVPLSVSSLLFFVDVFWEWYMGFIVYNGGEVVPFRSFILGL